MALNWIARTLPASKAWTAAVWNGSVFCVVSSDGFSAASADGITWTLGTFPAGIQPVAITSGNGLFVVADYTFGSTATATSTDGINWTSRTLPTGQTWRTAGWNGTNFVLLGNTNYAVTSPTGEIWTLHNMPSNAGWQSVAWNGTVFVAAKIADAASVATSPTGEIWTTRVLPTNTEPGFNIGGVAWNGSVFCAVPSSGNAGVFTNTDGTNWIYRARALPAACNTGSATQPLWAQNGTFFLLGDATHLYSSNDGMSWAAQVYPGSAGGLTANNTILLAIVGNSASAATAVLETSPPAFWTGYSLTSEVDRWVTS